MGILDQPSVSQAGTTAGAPVVAKSLTDARTGVWEYIHNSPTGYLFHLMNGVNSGSALIGLGIDNGGLGLFVNNKQTGVGIKIDQNATITSATAYGLEINQRSALAPAVYVGAAKASAPAILLMGASDVNAGQSLLRVITGSGEQGNITADTGKIRWKADIETRDGGVFRATGNSAAAQDNQTKIKSGEVQFSTFTGSTDQYWHKRIRHNGQSLLVETANTLAGGVDAAPTYSTALEVKNSGGTTQLGFFGTAPASKPVLSYSRAIENAAQTQLRTALAALGLVTDSTTA